MGSFYPSAMILFVTLTISLAIVAAAEADANQLDNKRNPKLFFVSSTTSTLSTTTICYKSSTTARACGRRRRSMIVDKVSGQESDIDFSGISKTGSADDESSQELESTKSGREGKFLLYWMTTTSTSTTYTATTTVSSLDCTPSGFVISNCTG